MFFLELFEVLSWFEGTILQEKEEQVLGFPFQQLKLEVVLDIVGLRMFENIYLRMILDTHFLKTCPSEITSHYKS